MHPPFLAVSFAHPPKMFSGRAEAHRAMKRKLPDSQKEIIAISLAISLLGKNSVQQQSQLQEPLFSELDPIFLLSPFLVLI